MFLLPEVSHSPQVLGSPPQTGSCNPPLGPLLFEEGGLYLKEENNKSLGVFNKNEVINSPLKVTSYFLYLHYI